MISKIHSYEKIANELIKSLISLNKDGITPEQIAKLVQFLESKQVSIPTPDGLKVFDVCGTGGTKKQRINLSTVLSVRLSADFTITKHGNKASSGRCGSFDVLEHLDEAICTMPEAAQKSLIENNRAFLYAPAFHPILGLFAPLRKQISDPTIFNYVGVLLNPMKHLTAQLIGCKDIQTAQLLAEACVILNKNALLVHDTFHGLDEVSIGGTTHFFEVVDEKIQEGTFEPEDYDMIPVTDFNQIKGTNSILANAKIVKALISKTAPAAHEAFLEINYRVATQFFSQF